MGIINAERRPLNSAFGARLGQSAGTFIRDIQNMVEQRKAQKLKEEVTQELFAYSQTEEAKNADPVQFGAKLVQLVESRGAVPGPIVQRLMDAKKAVWAHMQGQQDAEARETRAAAAKILEKQEVSALKQEEEEAKAADKELRIKRFAQATVPADPLVYDDFDPAYGGESENLTPEQRAERERITTGLMADIPETLLLEKKTKPKRVGAYEAEQEGVPGVLSVYEDNTQQWAPFPEGTKRVAPPRVEPRVPPNKVEGDTGVALYDDSGNLIKELPYPGGKKQSARAETPTRVEGETGVALYDAEGNLIRTLPYPGGKKQTAGSVTDPFTNPQVQAVGDALMAGDATPYLKSSARGNFRSAVAQYVREINPEFNFTEAVARAGMATNVNMNKAIGILDSIRKPINGKKSILEEFKEAHKKLGFTRFPAANAGKRLILEQIGSGAIKDYDNLRNALAMELGNAFAAAALTDARMKVELENLPRNPSPEQIEHIEKTLRKLIDARVDTWRGAQGLGEKTPPPDPQQSTDRPTRPGAKGETLNGWTFKEIRPRTWDWVR